MRKIFQQLVDIIRQFIRQRTNLLLLIPCQDSDTALLLAAIRDLDRQSATDLFLLFADDFQSADSFVSSMAARLREEHELTNQSTAPDVAKLPPLPSELFAASEPPSKRLEAGLGYARSLIDQSRGQHFLWGMGPAKIEAPQRYLELLASLTPDPEIRPFMRGARIVARVPVDFQLEGSPLAKARRIEVQSFTIPPNAQEEELLAAANDARVPLADRMQSEVQLGYLDAAHGRFAQAESRFSKALAFFQWAELPMLQGLVISGLGDIARRQGNLQKAQDFYCCVLAANGTGISPILLSTVLQSLAAIAFQEKRYQDAEERYAELVTLKRSMLDEKGLTDALEWRGISQAEQRAYDQAVESFEEGALICKAFALWDRLPQLLARLRHGYVELQMHSKLESFDAVWNGRAEQS
jgi:tetratricopeptide (TPR) repeat protein